MAFWVAGTTSIFFYHRCVGLLEHCPIFAFLLLSFFIFAGTSLKILLPPYSFFCWNRQFLCFNRVLEFYVALVFLLDVAFSFATTGYTDAGTFGKLQCRVTTGEGAATVLQPMVAEPQSVAGSFLRNLSSCSLSTVVLRQLRRRFCVGHGHHGTGGTHGREGERKAVTMAIVIHSAHA